MFSFEYVSKPVQVTHCTSLHFKQIYVYFGNVRIIVSSQRACLLCPGVERYQS